MFFKKFFKNIKYLKRRKKLIKYLQKKIKIMNKFSLFANQIDENPNDIIEHDLYNEKNFLINKYQVQEILKQCEIDYKIKNLELYQRAFIHKSYIEKEECVKIVDNKVNALELQKKSYERLEFLGDSILGAIVVSYLYQRFFDQNEGTMTKYKAKLVSKKALSEFSKILGFSKYFVICVFKSFTNVSCFFFC